MGVYGSVAPKNNCAMPLQLSKMQGNILGKNFLMLEKFEQILRIIFQNSGGLDPITDSIVQPQQSHRVTHPLQLVQGG